MDRESIPKAYESKQYEDEIYAVWEKSGFFNPDYLPGDRSEIFSIVLPPPNVTGTLHMGHAVMLAIEDLLIRFARMRGKKTVWIPGTDHAAIATQTKVEKLLMKDGMKDPRGKLGRDEFLKRVEKFASESHDIIINQAKKMGASMDWSREAFTLDPARHRAVNQAFFMMYSDGLIYRGDRVINWCPRCQSTLADDEVEYKEEKTLFYYLKYGPVVIGTARPETKFADKVILVHPDDERYTDLVGKEMEVEWIEGSIKAKMVADEVVDRSFGTGAMTITPAHSFEDFELAKKYGFEVLKIIDEDGNLTQAAGSFAGRNAQKSRAEIVEVLRRKGLVDHIDENYSHHLSVCYRCGAAVEPLPKLQWFIDVHKPFVFRASSHAPIKGLADGQQVTLKDLLQHVVRTKQVRMIPDRFEKTYFHWIDHLRDWNISRQIWYGHRVPVWYRTPPLVIPSERQRVEGPLSDKEVYVGVVAPEGEGWVQDPDTLDTWFSAGLWTLSTLGWPDKTDDLRQYHPLSVLETGYDILFFWVARMILMTTYAIGEIPFRDVYLHGLVRDEQGRKMSKSLENNMDPLDMIARYGADATRLSLIIGTTPGNDTKLSEEKVAGYRNFTNKLWNIARFVLGVTPEGSLNLLRSREMTMADQWILSRFATVTQEVTAHLEKYEFSQAGEKLRDFTWNEFADWYLEMAKIQLKDPNFQSSTSHLLRSILRDLLILWHPFMPFVTEVLFSVIPGLPDSSLLMIQPWPKSDETHKDQKAEQDFTLIQQVITAIRNIRAQHHIEPKQLVTVFILADESHRRLLDSARQIIVTLSRAESIDFIETELSNAVVAVVGSMRVFVLVSKQVDVKRERDRLTKEMEELDRYLIGMEEKMANPELVSKAPPQVIKEMKEKHRQAQIKHQALLNQRNFLSN